MKSSLTKSIVLSSSLLLALTVLSGCGKDKEVKANPPAQATPTTPSTDMPAQISSADQTPSANLPQQPPALNSPNQQLPEGNLVNPTPDQQPGLPNQGLPSIPQAGSGRGTRGGQQQTPQLPPQTQLPGIPDQPLNPLNPQTPDLPTVDQAQGQNPQTLPKLPTEATRAYQVDFTNQVAVKTGGQDNGLFYTSVGNDALMEEFKSYGAKVSLDQQNKNNLLAKAIVNAKLSRSSANGPMSIQLTVNEFGTLYTYRLVVNANADQMNLSPSRVGTTGQMNFQGGFLKCLDVDGGCEVAYAKMKFEGGYTRVIFRNVADDLHFLVQNNVANNSAFATWANYISNAVNNVQASQKVEGMKVSSFEVVNGQAAAGAMLTTLDRQVIGFNIPMMVSSTNSDVNIAVAKNADLSKNYDLANLTGSYSTELSRSINAVRLVKNNGRGQFKLQLQFGSDAVPASIWLVGAGMQKPTISLDQIRSFESKLRAF